MTPKEQKAAAEAFAKRWRGRGYEKGESQKFWIGLLQEVYGMDYDDITFEEHIEGTYRDGYIPSTKVLIEQKSSSVDLNAPVHKVDGKMVTAYEQAENYNNKLDYDKRARWIITCNFREFHIHDMNHRSDPPYIIKLEDLPTEYSKLAFIASERNVHLQREKKVSMEAGTLVGKLYNAVKPLYADPDSVESLKSLNRFCVRVVFCLYAEDAELFESSLFSDYVEGFSARHLRRGLLDLFEHLDTPVEERGSYVPEDLRPFPYVNGGLFRGEIEIPNLTDEVRTIIYKDMGAGFNWSEISPTIFGGVFESTLNPQTRREGGMHYTAVENIHKVIDPLFLNDLRNELMNIEAEKVPSKRRALLEQYQDRLASLKFFDPACGSGNFLTETFISLRRLENKVLEDLFVFTEEKYQRRFLTSEQIVKVSVTQFYGIEINDFAVAVAQTALWIAESQMLAKTENIVGTAIDFFPLTSQPGIVEGNSIRMDWNEVVKASDVNYIMGNPPFLGYSNQSVEQKKDVLSVYVDEKGKPYKTAGKIDYVSCWFWKAAEMMASNSGIHTALVSTNSITQGEQVAYVWKPLYERFNIHIDFAYKTFQWDSEASSKAHVHCVIVGFSVGDNASEKFLFDGNIVTKARQINPYLIDAPLMFIESRTKPICDVPEMSTGNRPADGGHLIIEDNEYEDFIKKEPHAKPYIKALTGSEEYINGKKRWCLWLIDLKPEEIIAMPEVFKRVELCRKDRLQGASDRQKLAATPWLFRETLNPDNSIIIPVVSSERRKYVPMGYIGKDIISNDRAKLVPNAERYHFGIMESSVHMAWMRIVCGRLKSDYNYSKNIVYNNFPWPTPSESQKSKIESTAQAILDAREKYPNSTLADLYDPDKDFLYPELVKAHKANDEAVLEAYGYPKNITEADIVADLFKRYQQLTSKKV